MDLTPCKLSDLSRVHTEFATGPMPSGTFGNVLVVAFHGEADNRREVFGTYAMMRAMIAAGVAAWSPGALVLDLGGLAYVWGDQMAEVIADDGRPPTAVVVSDLNREGLTSLVEKEMSAKRDDWLFDSVEEAVNAVDRTLVAERSRYSHDFS